MGLRQQMMSKEVMAIEEIGISRRKEADYNTLECKDNEEKIYISG